MKNYILVEIIARVVKNAVRSQMRSIRSATSDKEYYQVFFLPYVLK